jgi:Ca-activated chloride channel family protein
MRWITLAAVITLMAGSSHAATYETVEEGRSLFEQEKYAEAYEKFHEAAADLPEEPLLEFNKAATFYKRSDYDKAIELYEKALATKDLQLEATARYNLGNCYFQQAVKHQTDYDAAIALLTGAMACYRDALEVLPDSHQARYNLEKSKLLRKLLRDKKKKQEEEQKKNQPQPDDKEEQQKEGEQDQQKGDDQNQGQEEQPQPQAGGEEKKQELSPEDAEKLLNAIRERQQQREREERVRQPMGYAPVGKDW